MLALLYAALVIKNEKDAYIENSNDMEFFNFRLFIPSWWGKRETSQSNELIFERQDTRYDWYCSFQYFPDNDRLTKEIVKEFIEKNQWVFDPEELIEFSEPEAFFTESKTKERIEDFFRMEGTGTKAVETRCYFDIICIRDLMADGYLLAFSESSILNGGVDGPYFETLVKQLEIVD